LEALNFKNLWNFQIKKHEKLQLLFWISFSIYFICFVKLI
jgi:hypothetical protein